MCGKVYLSDYLDMVTGLPIPLYNPLALETLLGVFDPDIDIEDKDLCWCCHDPDNILQMGGYRLVEYDDIMDEWHAVRRPVRENTYTPTKKINMPRNIEVTNYLL
jgi:hypothetical protein